MLSSLCRARFRHQHAEKTSATNYNYRQAASGANCESGGTRQSHPAKDPKRTLNTNQHSDPIAGFLYHIWKSSATSLCNLCFCSNTLHICSHMFTYVSCNGNRHSGRDPVAVSVPPLWVRFIELQMPSCPLARHIPAWGVLTIAMPDDTMWSNVQSVICIKNHYRKLSHFRLAEQFAVCKTQ